MNVYVALLRGINVGGKNPIPMTGLAACFTDLGFDKVRTYIQSGNVIFGATESDQARLTALIEETLSTAFNYESRIVLRSYAQMKGIVGQAPEGFGGDPSTYRYDVWFLKEPLTATEVVQGVALREGVDQAFAGNGVIYASRLISRASQTYLTRIIGTPVYQGMTIRNWNTTTRLLQMMETDGQ
jgi:uncharacterized protein (DUF1697 family)